MARRRLDETARQELLIADGAMGTQLQARGLETGAPGELWNVARPDQVLAVHRSYREAGAQAILTNSLGGSRWKLQAAGEGHRVAELNRAAAGLAREAAREQAWVLGDVGPTGRFVAPLGTDSFEEFVAVFGEQIEALLAGGVDGILVETMSDLEEALAALQAAKALSDLPVAVTMTFTPDRSGGDYHTVMGVGVEEAVQTLQEAGADLIGSNCSVGSQAMLGIVKRLAPVAAVPVVAKPNAGLPRLVAGQTVFEEAPEQFARTAARLVGAGARVVGGCCGTTPDHIAGLAKELAEGV
jgi:5-methyltetrahydrofolate--homocysteine methyltransferase